MHMPRVAPNHMHFQREKHDESCMIFMTVSALLLGLGLLAAGLCLFLGGDRKIGTVPTTELALLAAGATLIHAPVLFGPCAKRYISYSQARHLSLSP